MYELILQKEKFETLTYESFLIVSKKAQVIMET